MKKVKIKVNGVWTEMVGITNRTSWDNYMALRNRTKTTIEAGEIDTSTLTGTNAAIAIFSQMAFTSAVVDFRLLQGTACFQLAFSQNSSLIYLRLNLASLIGTLCVSSIFTGTNNINTLVLDGISNQNNNSSDFT